MAEISVSGALQFLLSLGAKIAYTVILVGIVVLCLSEVYKVWGDRSPVLTIFGYNKDGTAIAASGEGFTRHLEQQQRLLGSLFDGQARSHGNPILTDEARIQFGGVNVAELRTSDLSELKIEAQGINLTAILGRLRNWIRQPNEIRGRIDQVGETFHVFAEWRETGSGAPQTRYYNEIHKDLGTASFEIAARLLWQDIIQQSDPPLLARSLIQQVSEDNFVKFIRAWTTYQVYSAARDRGEDLASHKARLEQAIRDADYLLERNVAFPPVYNLAAYLKLQAKSVDTLTKDEKARIRDLLNRYLAAIAELGLSDTQAEKNLAALSEVEQAATRVAAATSAAAPLGAVQPGVAPPTRSVALAGASIGPEGFNTAATACCVVRNLTGKRFLLTADYVFPADILAKDPHPMVISPAALDGGKQRIGALSGTYALPDRSAGIALIALDDDVEAKNEIPDIGRIGGIAEIPPEGEILRLFGRSSELRSGKVLRESAIPVQAQKALSPALVPVERISGPGDGGAPVVDLQGNLVAMAYAGSESTSLVLPVKKLFEDLGLDLVTD